MPVARSIVIGFITAALIAGLTPLLQLGEWNGPINFAPALVAAITLALALAVFIARPKGWRGAFACAFGFAMPVAASCFLIPRFDPIALAKHAKEFGFAGAFAVTLSFIVMAVLASKDNDNW
jgi:predicted MFS family arabinose efflux permease